MAGIFFFTFLQNLRREITLSCFIECMAPYARIKTLLFCELKFKIKSICLLQHTSSNKYVSFQTMEKKSILQLVHDNLKYLEKSLEDDLITKEELVYDMRQRHVEMITQIVKTVSQTNFVIPIDPCNETERFIES